MENRNKAVMAGGRRIKQNRHNTKRVSNPETKYIKNVKNFNNRIETISDGDYIKFRDYSTNLVQQITDELKRDYFKDRDEFRKYKENKLKYLYTVLFYPKDNIKIYFKSDNFRFIEKTFSNQGVKVIEKLLNILDQTITEKKYEVVDKESLYNKEIFDECLDNLDISSEEKVSFSKIREAYNNKKELAGGNEEAKEIVNRSFITLRNQYDNYLKEHM